MHKESFAVNRFGEIGKTPLIVDTDEGSSLMVARITHKTSRKVTRREDGLM